MNLNLKKPLIIFDLETTGLDIVQDRIIQISYIKVFPDGKEERNNIFVNPLKTIPKEVEDLTGITNQRVENEKPFKDIAPLLAKTFEGCDFAGFNSNRFDIPMLAEEFGHAGIDFDFTKANLVDVQVIYHKMERRNLAAAYRFYCGRLMEDDFEAHRADNDTEATYRVLQKQVEYYSDQNQSDKQNVLPNNVEALAAFSKNGDNVDFAGRFVWKELKDAQGKTILDDKGKPVVTEVFNFGKYKGKRVIDVLNAEPGYYNWMMTSDFSQNTKDTLARIKLKELANKFNNK